MERKLASVLFVDLVDSTGFVSMSDPEVVRRRVTRFFDQVSACIAAHGGIVEKFAGDAVMAAFGVPLAHEDDAERAVRAGLATLESVHKLDLEARVGVESGEVVVDDTDSTFATGEAVNIAARLQQAAAPGELLIGPAAHRLTLGRIEVEDVGPLELRGRPEPLWAWRAVCATYGWRLSSGFGAPLVGREAELELLENTFDRAKRDRRAHVFTIYGEPGVGKSRLAREYVEGLESATVLFGRCLPYGEGITYWPLGEMVKSASGIADDDPLEQAVAKLAATCENEAVADLLALASGLLEAMGGDRSAQEIAWAAREWAERLADDQPLVLVFEDIHWAEEPLLELIEHLAVWVRQSPLLLLCLARPELLDVRPGWGGGRVRATAIELEPLARAESAELVAGLIRQSGETLPPELRMALYEKTEGNPLFLEETVRMLVEDGDGVVTRIPDTLHALIAARIDRLPPKQRIVAQRAAVIGRIFWAGAIEHLSPEVEVEAAIDGLLLREFVLLEPRSTITGETAYRFKHVLIREVAYGGLTKSARAKHHLHFAEWLLERAGEELLEIRAYHLDRACTLYAELDGGPPADVALEAAEALEAAGRRALAREANRSARKLFLRSVELGPTLARRFLAGIAALRLSDLPAVSREMEEVCRAAADAGETRIEGRALGALAEVALLRDADLPRARRLADRALELLGEPDDARFHALTTRASVAWYAGDLSAVEHYLQEELAIAQATGRKDLESRVADSLAGVYKYRLELDEAEPVVARALALADESGSIVARAGALYSVAGLDLIRGQLDAAEAALQESRALYAEAGRGWELARTLNTLAWVASYRGDPVRAERLLREAAKILTPVGDRLTLCETQRGLAQALVLQGRLDEAERFALAARETVGPHDITSLATTSLALAIVRAAQGRDEEAEGLFHEALAYLDGKELRWCEIEILAPLKAFLRERGRLEEAEAVAERLDELGAVFPPGYAMAESAAPIA